MQSKSIKMYTDYGQNVNLLNGIITLKTLTKGKNQKIYATHSMYINLFKIKFRIKRMKKNVKLTLLKMRNLHFFKCSIICNVPGKRKDAKKFVIDMKHNSIICR